MTERHEQRRVRQRLGMGFGIAILFSLMVSWLAITKLDRLAELTFDLHRHPYTVTAAALEIGGNVAALRASMTEIVTATNPLAVEDAARRAAEQEQATLQAFLLIKDRFLGDPERVDEARAVFLDWSETRHQVLARSRDGDAQAALALYRTQGSKQFEQLNQALTGVIAFARNKAGQYITEAEDAQRRTRASIITLLAICILAFTAIFGFIAHEIIRFHQRATRDLITDLADARDRAEAANVAKSTFVATISHELRTPMNGVLGAARLLERSDLAPDQKDYLDILRSAGGSLMSILNDLLDFSKIEANRLSIVLTKTRLAPLLRDIANSWAGAAELKNIAFTADFADDLPRWVICDPTRLAQILNNLLSNAVKYTPGGKIRLGVSAVAAGDGHITLECRISDTGIGIAEPDIARLFQPFEQLDGSRTRTVGGTGLGLAISQRLARQMGGDIEVTSKLLEGSAFTLKLKLKVARGEVDETSSQAAAEPETLAPLSILLAEDNILNCRILESMLGGVGHKIVIAHHGEEALKLLGQQDFDLVLMDVNMPVMDGLAATRAIRALQGPKADIPVIMLSAAAMAEERANGLVAGADDYVTKPIDPQELAAAIARVAHGRPRAAPDREIRIAE